MSNHYDELIDICKKGNLKDLILYSKCNDICPDNKVGLRWAAERGHLVIVMYYFTTYPKYCALLINENESYTDTKYINSKYNKKYEKCVFRSKSDTFFFVYKDELVGAAANGHIEVVRYLIETKIKYALNDALYHSMLNNHEKCVAFLIENGATPNSYIKKLTFNHKSILQINYRDICTSREGVFITNNKYHRDNNIHTLTKIIKKGKMYLLPYSYKLKYFSECIFIDSPQNTEFNNADICAISKDEIDYSNDIVVGCKNCKNVFKKCKLLNWFDLDTTKKYTCPTCREPKQQYYIVKREYVDGNRI